jgi:hypothetical protein
MIAHLISPSLALQRLEHEERLCAFMAKTNDAAHCWNNACRAALGEIVGDVLRVPDGQKKLLRWHDGTMTLARSPRRLLAVHSQVTWFVATTRECDANPVSCLAERFLQVEAFLNAMPASIVEECEKHCRLNRELFELDVRNFLNDNQGGR